MRSTERSKKAADVTTLLEKDHADVRKLLTRLESARSPSQRSSLISRIDREVLAHARVEEELFYPAFHRAAKGHEDEKMFFEAAEEHHLVDLVLAELRRTDPGTDPFAAKAKVLKDLVEHHAEEEEDELFPRARRLLEKEELVEIGRRVKARKKELLADGPAAAPGKASAA
jgi:hemerythrin superfamily protein